MLKDKENARIYQRSVLIITKLSQNFRIAFISELKIMKYTVNIGQKKSLEKTNYIIYGSEMALGLYEKSLDALMASDNCDFDVARCTPNHPITSLLDDFVPFERFLFINAYTYEMLRLNLRQKVYKTVGLSTSDSRTRSN